MAGFVRTRTKRVTYPLDDKVRARLVGGYSSDLSIYDVSSGSEHSGDGDSPCLSELVHDFLQDDSSETWLPDNETDSDRVDSVSDAKAMDSILRSAAVSGNEDSFAKLLRSHVSEAVEAFSCLRSGDKSALRRSVMSFLRARGHNAAICKTNWSSSGNITAGSYEFIDVVCAQSSSSMWQSRYFVDLDFAAQLEIARPTSQYSRLLQLLPKDFIGSSEDLKRIVRVMSDAVKRSLRSRELSVPPWRKNRYMQNKWFGPYKRTVNPLTEKSFSISSTVFAPVSGAKCRWVGFDDAVSDSSVNGRLYVRT
ncbi:unnamed protein product [Prunus armeniaca]|uniref:DUF506 family protein n=3 Tax=Prunus armeniaca TaxID=36596 RepID=A0A6J5VU06_PRUAR|nr:unnamed protein product [Prunus armeniaca]